MSVVEKKEFKEPLVRENVEEFLESLAQEFKAPLYLWVQNSVVSLRDQNSRRSDIDILKAWLLNAGHLSPGAVAYAKGILAEKVVKDMLAAVLGNGELVIQLTPSSLNNSVQHRGGDILIARRFRGDALDPLLLADVTLTKRNAQLYGKERQQLGRNEQFKTPVIVLPVGQVVCWSNRGLQCGMADYLTLCVKPMIREGRYKGLPDSYPLILTVIEDQLIQSIKQGVWGRTEILQNRGEVYPHDPQILQKLNEMAALFARANP